MIEDDIKRMMETPYMKFVLDMLDKYDRQYRGNVPEQEARKLFPEMFKK